MELKYTRFGFVSSNFDFKFPIFVFEFTVLGLNSPVLGLYSPVSAPIEVKSLDSWSLKAPH